MGSPRRHPLSSQSSQYSTSNITSMASRFRTAKWLLFALFAVSLLFAPADADGIKKSAADYFVRSLPGAPEGVPLRTMHAGHIRVNEEHNGNMFFWHYQNRHIAEKPRTVIWLNGGPGCSSEDGVLMEVGPYRVRKGGKLVENPGSWDEYANLLFVDNPVGTGFSYVDTDSFVHELDEMADQFVIFLERFFEIFPHFRNDELYLTGESYAGQYIPYIAKAILERNKKSGSPWNLGGLAIGNGWISPVDQYLTYRKFTNEVGLIPADSDKDKRVQAQEAICIKALSDTNGADHVDTPNCEQVLQEILSITQDSKQAPNTCINMYDIRLRDSFPSCGMAWPPDLSDVTPYLRREEVKRALNVDSAKRSGWTECNGAVGGAFTVAKSLPSVKLLPDLLRQVPILLFAGDKDLICNYMGIEELINNLEFNGGKGFETTTGVWAPRQEWLFEGEPAGMYQEARNLTYLRFYNSSHMVPFDHPRRSRDMLNRFMGVNVTSAPIPVPPSRLQSGSNSTQAQQAKEHELQEATRKAYYRSGQVALVVVAFAVGIWGWWIWRHRRENALYTRLVGSSGPDTEMGMAHELSRSANREMADRFLSPQQQTYPDGTSHPKSSRSLDSRQPRYSLGSLGDDGTESEGDSPRPASGSSKESSQPSSSSSSRPRP